MGPHDALDAVIALLQRARDHTQPLRGSPNLSDSALFIDQRRLRWQLDALVSEWATLPDEVKAHDEFDHKVRQHHERVQAHLNQIDARVAARANAEWGGVPNG